MEKTTIEITKITASDGMMLTNGKVYSDEVYLGVNDSPDNWHEIPLAEYEALMTEQENEIN